MLSASTILPNFYFALLRVDVLRVDVTHLQRSHIEMGLHFGCSLVAASLKGLQDTSVYQVMQPETHYTRRVKACASEGLDLPPPPSDKACVQPGTSLTAPLFAEVAGWTANVRCFQH